MRKILGTLILATIWLCAPHAAHAACSGSTPNYTAASASAADVSACLTLATHCGDIISVPASAGVSTWTSLVTVTPATGCAANQGLTIQGATACATGCSPGSAGSGLAFTDSSGTCSGAGTCILFGSGGELSLGIFASTALSNTSFVRVTGFTFKVAGAQPASGAIQAFGTISQVGIRFDHNHFIGTGGIEFTGSEGAGLIDHVFFDNTPSSTTVPLNFYGDFPSKGYAQWALTTQLGTNQSWIIEDNRYNSTVSSAEGFFDAYAGCMLTIRYNTINGDQVGGWHGTDSGGYRGCVYGEIYNNTLVNNNGAEAIMNTRSGVLYFYNNNMSGTGVTSGIALSFYRLDQPGPVEQATWGAFMQGVNWTPIKTTPGTNCGSADCVAYVTANAPNWQASHSYTCSTSVPCVVGPLTNNTGVSGAGGYNFATITSCTSGSSNPATWNQTVAGTQADNTCTWTNIGGGTAASPNPGSADGFQTANPDTVCTSGACGRFLDANGGVYPGRDQPGFAHNQVSTPNYSWNNTLPGAATPLFVVDGTAVQLGRDAFNTTTAPGYTPYTYPDPLQGGTVVLSPSSENFGSVNVGSSSAPITFTLTNNNATTATSISPSVTGGNSGDFSITNSGAGSCSAAGGSIATGASCTFTVTFSPTASGARSTTLSVSYSGGDGASPQTAALSGTGVSTGTAAGSSISGGVKISGGVTIK